MQKGQKIARQTLTRHKDGGKNHPQCRKLALNVVKQSILRVLERP
jgi:hypothetical protein